MWSLDQTLQYVAWFIALLELIVGLYVLVPDPRHTVRLHVGLTLFVSAAFTFGVGSLLGAQNDSDAALPTLLIAVTYMPRLILLGLTSVTMLKSSWLRRPHLAWLRRILQAAVWLPAAASLLDAWQQTNLYYTGLDPAVYARGFVAPAQFLQGALAPAWNAAVLFGGGALLVLIMAGLVLFDRNLAPIQRRLGVWLLGICAVNWLPGTLAVSNPTFLWAAIFAGGAVLVTFAVLAFQEFAFEKRLEQRARRGSLAARLIFLLLIVSLPLLAAMALFLTNQARTQLQQGAVTSLADSSRAASESVDVWLAANTRMLKTLALNNDINGMNAADQLPVLRNLVSTYPYIALAGVTDLTGATISRSDGKPPADYSSQTWFQQISNGRAVVFQVLAGPDALPGLTQVLMMAAPVNDPQGRLAGVVFATASLDQIARLVQQTVLTRTGQVYLVDSRDQVVTHSNPAVLPGESLADYPSIALLRSGTIGSMQFTDQDGLAWRAHSNLLSNGWGVVVQEDESTLFAPIRAFQTLGLLVLAVGVATLLLFTRSAINQGLAPVRKLTETATAISGGDIARLAPVESQDELGTLAEAFNGMTAQMRDLIAGLETRVGERTRDLERRALQLQVTAEVAREAAAIRELDPLLRSVTQLISSRLEHYHVGIFFIEGASPSGQLGGDPGYAVLRAANSEGGERMLKRGHRLKVGQVGIVGFAAATGQPRIALDVGRDAVYFNNPDLPFTRSEVALPLKLQDQVLGVLDVQSRKASAFTEEDMSILQILADQVTLAIENARLIEESRRAVTELESLYGRQVESGWRKRLGGQPLVYHLDAYGVHAGAPPQQPSSSPLSDAAQSPGADVSAEAEAFSRARVIETPIQLRGRRLGVLRLHRSAEVGDWSAKDKDMLDQVLGQVAQSLENARLLQEIQTRARQEEQLNRIIAQAQSSLNLETMMRSTVQELTQTLNLSRVRIRLGAPQPPAQPSAKEQTGASLEAELEPAESAPQASPPLSESAAHLPGEQA